MIIVALRYGVIAAGVVFVAIAAASWRSGTPPTWSLVAPRDEARVTSTEIASERVGNGTIRSRARVEIAWPGEGDRLLLPGVEPSFYGGGRREAEDILGAYPVGERVSVRLVDGMPMADRTDLFHMAHAVFMSLGAAVVLLIGLVLNRALKP